MLVSCPGCGKKVSDRAPQCPFCQASVLPSAAPASVAVPPPSPRAPAPALPGRYERGDSIGDAFRVRDVLGEGGFGIVYLVHPKGSAALYALKTIRDEWLRDEATRELFRKEAQLWIALGRHPYLVRAHYVHEDHGRLFIAMEYVAPDGRGIHSLQGYLDRDPPDLDRALRWAIQACHGLEFAYSRGIRCHRDIKPPNILVGADGAVRVTDFGIAGLVAPGGAAAALPVSGIEGAGQTVAGAVFGTPTHMPPEQFADAASCDERSDVYSLGVVLYQLASRGALPFLPEVPPGPDAGRRAFFALRQMHERAEPPPLASPLWPIVARCLHKEREERYPRVAALRAELEALLRERTGETVTVPASETTEAMELCQQGMSFASLGQEDEALACYDRALGLAPNEAALHNNRGNSLSHKGRVEEALAAFSCALELRPRYDTALVNRALALARAGRTAEGLPDCERALAINARSAEAWVTRGVILAGLGRRPEAMEAYDRALEIDGRDPVAWGNKAGNLLELGRLDEALAGYERALSIDPRSAERWVGKGTTLGEMARHAEAVACYDEGLRLDRANPRGWYNKGNSLVQLQRYEEALACFRETNRLAPQAGIAHYNRALCELTLERPREAESSFRRYLEMCPGDELAGQARWLLEGIESGQLTKLQRSDKGPQAGRLRSAEPAPAAPVVTPPSPPPPGTPVVAAPIAPPVPPPRPLPGLGPSAERLNNQAKTHFQAGRFAECAELSRQALELEPWNAVAWGNLANARFKLGQVEDALSAFDQALGGEGIQVDHWVSKAAVEQMSGRKSEALRSCLEFLALAGPKQQGFVAAIQKQAGALQHAGVQPAPRCAFGFLHEGAFHGAAGRMREAVASFDQALALDPRLASAWVFRAEALVQMRDPDAAARAIEEALTALPDDPRVWHKKGALLAARRLFAEAVECFDRALAAEARYAAAWSDRGKYLGVLGRYEGAVESLERAIALCPDAPAPWQNKALAEETMGRSADAVVSYRMFLERAQPGQELQVEAAKDRLALLEPLVCEAHPSSPPPIAPAVRTGEAGTVTAPLPSDPGLAALQAGRFEEAMPLLRAAAASPRADATDWANLGLCLKCLGRAGDAMEAYDQALALDGRNVSALTNKAVLLDRQGSDVARELALSLLMKAALAAGVGPGASLAWTNLGVAYAGRGVHALAVEALDKAVELDPRNAEALEARADSLARQDRPADALASAEACLQLEPARAHAWYLRANALSKMGRGEESLADYDRAIQLDPKKANAYFNKAYELFELKRYGEVPPPCEAAVRLHPGFSWAEELHARALEALSRPDEALARFDRALAIDPSYLGAHYHKGLLLRRQKRYPEAVATLDQALALAPKNALVLSAKAECLQTLARLGATDVPPPPAAGGPAEAVAGAGLPPAEAMKKALFCQNQGQHERALQWFDACLSGDPGNVTALAAKGESLRFLGRYAEALPCFDRALARNPVHAPTWLKKGACLDTLKRFGEALAAFDRAIEHDPKNALAWNGRGLALGSLGRTDDAVAAFEDALALDPRSPLPRLNVAELLDRLGRHEEAAKAYQQFLGVASPVLLATQAQRARARLHEIRGGGR